MNTRRALVSKPSEFIHTELATSMQSNITISSTYMDKNNLYQGLIKNNNNPEYKDADAK